MLWYPGHMAGARALVRENLKLVDLVMEVVDARIPFSSRNPELGPLIKAKPRLLVLNKADLADAGSTAKWEKWFSSQGIITVAIDALAGRGIGQALKQVQKLAEPVMAKLKRSGRKYRPARLMVVGIPNVGKSSLINRLAAKKRAATGAKPGITRGKQWVRVEGEQGLELLDTPGILWPRTDNKKVLLRLAATGALPEEVFPGEEVALWLCEFFLQSAPQQLINRYQLDSLADKPEVLLAAIGARRGFLLPGGIVDRERTARMLLKEFQDGKLGRHTLEQPGEGERGNV
ncbi:MAG: ribosome biogenesis GTPase YlqF [bacterium]|jgi:ribosome biogenesis GTPase A